MKVKGVVTSWVWARVLVFSLFSAAVLMHVGCSIDGNRGSLQRDRELDNLFLQYEVVQDHNYYFSGGYDKPNAILGIHKDYELVSDLWQPVQISSAQLEKWIRFIAPETHRGTGAYFAAYILDPEGKRVGFWYSVQSTTTIKFLEGNKIEVYTPDLLQHKPGPILLRSRGRL